MTTKKLKEYSICNKCMKKDWCKAYDNTDLSLNNCNDFMRERMTEKKLLKLFHNGINCLANGKKITYNNHKHLLLMLKFNEIEIRYKSN